MPPAAHAVLTAGFQVYHCYTILQTGEVSLGERAESESSASGLDVVSLCEEKEMRCKEVKDLLSNKWPVVKRQSWNSNLGS